MDAVPRRALLVVAGAALASVLPGGRASGDHGGPPRSAGMSPVAVGILAGALTLAVGIVVVVLVTRLTRKTPPSR